MKRVRGFTLIEMLVVVSVLVLAGFFLATVYSRAGRQVHCSNPCANNLGNLIKCCHLYADAVPNLGSFPLYNEEHNGNGHEALAKLFGLYVKDPRVFSCTNKTTKATNLVKYQEPDESTLQTGYTNYGYDPGHTPLHPTAGVIGDRGILSVTHHGNSTNHGPDAPGQNVVVGAGSVEWWDDADHRPAKDATDRATTDDIFADNIKLPDFPEELETNIIQ